MFQVNRFQLVCLMVSGLFLTGCWPFGKEDNKAVETKSEKVKLVIINVLDKAEYDDCHITGSININFDEFESKIATLNKANHYVLYCADYMCMSSGFCAKQLKDAGFEHVWAYEGGMTEWYQKGYPHVGAAQSEYLKANSEKLSDDEDAMVPTLTAEQLLEKMKEFGQNN